MEAAFRFCAFSPAIFYYTSTPLSTCLVTFQLPFSHQIWYCLDSLTESYRLQPSVSEVFNNQLCMQFTRRLMWHEGMSHLRCHHLQMGLPVLSKADWLLKPARLQKREQLPCSKVHKLGTRRLRSLKETQVNDSSLKRLFHPELECSNSDQNRLMSPTVILIFLCLCISSGSAPI